MKKALITGVRGQDGAYLAKLLLRKGYEVIGADRRSGESSFWRLEHLGILDDIRIEFMDMLELTNIHRLLKKEKPDEIYNLAAQSFVGVSFEQPLLTSEVNSMGVCRLLESARDNCPETRFYQASTSEMFGKVRQTPQNEKTSFYPRSPYGISKLYSHWMTVNYRESYGLFTCSGILFNHESPLRGNEFVTKKIARNLVKIKAGRQDKFYLGNLSASRDWGYAPEYVEGMWRMLQQDRGDDYVLATGETRAIRDYVNKAAEVLDMRLEWSGRGLEEKAVWTETGKTILEVSPRFYRPAEVDALVGDSSKAYSKMKWKASTRFDKLVEMMVEYELSHL